MRGTDPFLQDLAGPGDPNHGDSGIPIDSQGSRTPPKKARTKNYQPSFAQYMHEGRCMPLV
jgi:hypothetical protein